VPGFGWLFFSAGQVGSPVPISGIDYGLELDVLLGAFPALTAFPLSAPIAVTSLPVPRKPRLVGQTIYLQGLTFLQQPAGFDLSFTNTEAVTFGSLAFSPPQFLSYAQDPVAYEVRLPIAPNLPSVDGLLDIAVFAAGF
jgi:hypothetical protein